MLKCSCCLQVKSVESFSKRTETKRGYKSHCKECIKTQNGKQIDTIKSKTKKYYEKNSTRIKETVRKYYFANKDKVRKYRREYWRVRKTNDVMVKLTINLRSRLSALVLTKDIKKTQKSLKYLGCTKQTLRTHLEQKFAEGMTWDNYGQWHIDHIIPLSSAKCEKDLYQLCKYTNLQPLWAVDNLKKGNKISHQLVNNNMTDYIKI